MEPFSSRASFFLPRTSVGLWSVAAMGTACVAMAWRRRRQHAFRPWGDPLSALRSDGGDMELFFPSEVPTSTSHFVNKVIRFVLLDLGSRGGWIRERIGFSRHFPSIGGGSNSTGMYFFPLDSSHSKRRWWNTLLGQRKQSTSDRSIFVCCARLFLPPYERTTTTWYVRGLQLQAVHTV